MNRVQLACWFATGRMRALAEVLWYSLSCGLSAVVAAVRIANLNRAGADGKLAFFLISHAFDSVRNRPWIQRLRGCRALFRAPPVAKRAPNANYDNTWTVSANSKMSCPRY